MNIIDTYRRRIAYAALARLKRKTGGNLLIIKLPDNKIETVEVNERFMNQLLLRFEGLTRCGLSRYEGDSTITAYQNAIGINKHTEYLTDSGKLIIDELLNEVVDYVKNKYASGGIN
ncbi:hypothetical protein DQY71_14840 [Salmonella enterica subsp. enterica serovar Tennessee]|nr:hypothetical protein [Salmonella enterica subsp. enterica serovar Tennessee]EBY5906510.1 hypothetical protein [Salmonella enterica subsp. enterica serovar Tennessee]ECF4905821.1 hypothetical protein [Salmonella enterica subsp. enterica serovar Tennessee]ECG2147594.1 hypothetical protein [Salmonella enterica subsp. enterica serovar Tennessee]ECR5983135.1 hypothetical protein [Salmonella enterica subsp. enterica serovar Tennessee]